jgi:hypothetical protein
MQPRACERDESFEVLFEFFVTYGESAEVLELCGASFDAIALPVKYLILGKLLFAVGFGRHDGDRSHGFDVVEDGLTVIALVGQHPARLSFSEQFDGLGTVVDLPASDQEVHRRPGS